MTDRTVEDTNQPRKSYYHRETPAVLKSWESLRRGRQELKVRLLQYSKTEPVLDIREYVTSDQFTGFSKKGITLDYDQIMSLRTLLEEVQLEMEKLP